MKRSVKIKEVVWMIACIGGALIFIFLMYFLYSDVDIMSATEEEYKSLVEQAIAIQQNPEMLSQIDDCNIKIKEENITVVFENVKCRLKVSYSKDFEYMVMDARDKRAYLIRPFLWSMLISFSFIYIVWIILEFIDRREKIQK